MNTSLNSKKGQGPAGFIGALMIVIIAGILLFTMLPIVNSFAQTTAGNVSLDGGSNEFVLLIRAIPLFMILAYIGGIFVVMTYLNG